jgi:hypothetical protein
MSLPLSEVVQTKPDLVRKLPPNPNRLLRFPQDCLPTRTNCSLTLDLWMSVSSTTWKGARVHSWNRGGALNSPMNTATDYDGRRRPTRISRTRYRGPYGHCCDRPFSIRPATEHRSTSPKKRRHPSSRSPNCMIRASYQGASTVSPIAAQATIPFDEAELLRSELRTGVARLDRVR